MGLSSRHFVTHFDKNDDEILERFLLIEIEILNIKKNFILFEINFCFHSIIRAVRRRYFIY